MCPEGRKFLKVIANLSNVYADATAYMVCIAGGNDREAFQRALKRARVLHASLRAARIKYESHVAQHSDKFHPDLALKPIADSCRQSPSAQSRSRLSSE